jgi:hypothetical protein
MDSVQFLASMSAKEVKKSLVEHDGLDPRIVVKG